VISENRGRRFILPAKNKATQLASGSGVQFPKGLTIADGFIRSIRDAKSKVNPRLNSIFESQQFKRWFGKSKVSNPDGKRECNSVAIEKTFINLKAFH